MTNLIEQIAAQWDGCMYEGVGGDIDIGQAIRDAGKDLAKEAGAAAAAAAEPHHVIGYTWTQADGKHRSIGAAPHPTNAHNIEPIYYPLAALTSATAVPEAVLDADELELFEMTVDQFEDCNETYTDYATLMRWARMGLLGCSHFAVTPEGKALIELKGVQPGERGEG